MNQADPPSINLDELRMMPDWLREEGAPPAKQYEAYAGEAPSRRDEGRRDGRPPGNRSDRDGARGPRRAPAKGSGGQNRPGDRPGGGRPGNREDRGPRRPEPAQRAPVAPAPVRVEFLPDERCLAGIVKQIRTTYLAYPLFGLARMFLQEPERHWLQLTVDPAAPGAQLHQLGEDGPVTLDLPALERIAFDQNRERFYAERTELREPLKGNYTNVARCRLSGTLLGPTNYHGYQPALRALYESKFSRRMSFEDFRRNIEIVTDPAVVERWKEEARSTTSIVTVDGEPPTVFASLAEARAHFKEHHLPGLIHSGSAFLVHGSVARELPEAPMMEAIREAHDRELRYPAQFVQLLRQGLQNAGLHIFKHRKRFVYVSVARPTPFQPDGAVSDNVRVILETVANNPLCSRKTLLHAIFGQAGAEPAPQPAEGAAPAEDPLAKARLALGADIRFLVQAGHLIEFHNGTFDLPLPPKQLAETAAEAAPAESTGGAAETLPQTA